MTFWPNSLTAWMQTVGPIATTAGLFFAWHSIWRQGRNREEDLERSQLEAARLVAATAGEDDVTNRVEEAVVRNNGPQPILDVHIWFEKHSDRMPLMIADDTDDGRPSWYLYGRFLAPNETSTWRRLSARLPEKKPMMDQVDFMVSWTSADGVHWLLRNFTELQRRPVARRISPDSLPSEHFRPRASSKEVFLDQDGA